jgi:hypothetical protein
MSNICLATTSRSPTHHGVSMHTTAPTSLTIPVYITVPDGMPERVSALMQTRALTAHFASSGPMVIDLLATARLLAREFLVVYTVLQYTSGRAEARVSSIHLSQDEAYQKLVRAMLTFYKNSKGEILITDCVRDLPLMLFEAELVAHWKVT